VTSERAPIIMSIRRHKFWSQRTGVVYTTDWW